MLGSDKSVNPRTMHSRTGSPLSGFQTIMRLSQLSIMQATNNCKKETEGREIKVALVIQWKADDNKRLENIFYKIMYSPKQKI